MAASNSLRNFRTSLVAWSSRISSFAERTLFYPTHPFSSWHPVPKLNPEIGDLVTGTNAIDFTSVHGLDQSSVVGVDLRPVKLAQGHVQGSHHCLFAVLSTCGAIDIMPTTPYHGVSTPSGSMCSHSTATRRACQKSLPKDATMATFALCPHGFLMGSCPILATPLNANSPFCASLVPSQRPLACVTSFIVPCSMLAAPSDTRTTPRPPTCAPSTTSWSRNTRSSTPTAHSRTWRRVWSSGRTSPTHIIWTSSWRKHNVPFPQPTLIVRSGHLFEHPNMYHMLHDVLSILCSGATCAFPCPSNRKSCTSADPPMRTCKSSLW